MILVFAVYSVQAQTSHNIAVNNNVFSPSSLTIQAGDEVVWTNNTGMGHNVNGNQSVYPDNPQSFGRSVGTEWVYSFVFTMPGTYYYQCDPHVSLGMTGTIVVQGTTGIDPDKVETIKAWPNPAIDNVSFESPNFPTGEINLRIINSKGQEVASRKINSISGEVQLNLGGLTEGIYLIEFSTKDFREYSRIIKK
jgi:plastocyanin